MLLFLCFNLSTSSQLLNQFLLHLLLQLFGICLVLLRFLWLRRTPFISLWFLSSLWRIHFGLIAQSPCYTPGHLQSASILSTSKSLHEEGDGSTWGKPYTVTLRIMQTPRTQNRIKPGLLLCNFPSCSSYCSRF